MKEYFSYENYGTNTYLKFTFPKDLDFDEFTLGMITNNKIDGFLQTVYGNMDDTRYIKYNVSSKITVKQFFSGIVDKRKLISVFHGILSAYITAEEYMIEAESIILDLDYIFVNVSTCQTEMICLPCEIDHENECDMMSFFKNLVFTLTFDQSENCDYIAKLINYLNSAGSFSCTGFKAIVDSIYETLNQSGQGTVHNAAYTVQPAPAVKSKESVQSFVSGDLPPRPVEQSQYQASPQQAFQQKPISISSSVPNTSNIPRGSNSASAVMERPPQAANISRTPISNTPPVPMNPVPQSGFTVPKSKAPAQQGNIPAVQNGDEKPMTMMYLLQHYNKENAAIYKAQKQARKNGSTTSSVPQPNLIQTKPNPLPQTNMGPAIRNTPSAPINNYRESVQQPSMNIQQNNVQTPPVVRQEFQATALPQQSFGDTTVLNAEPRVGETTVLNMNDLNSPRSLRIAYLIRKKNGEKIPINKNSFYIGKEKSFVDYFISDNSAISRSHANIVVKDGVYYIIDTNSTNHTFIDGKMIPSGVEVELESGIEITLANEKFDFQIL